MTSSGWWATPFPRLSPLESFLEVVEKVCRKIGIEIVNDAQSVFCLNVRIDAAESANANRSGHLDHRYSRP
jgi:hypothetical protein